MTVVPAVPAVAPVRLPRELLLVPPALLIGALVVVDPRLAVGAAAAGAVVVTTALRPAVGGWLVVAVTPLVVGIDRGRLVPGARPNEALLALVVLGLLVGALLRRESSALRAARPGAVVVSILLMAVASSILPIAWRVLRGLPVTADDVLYALVLWKYLALYAVVRCTVRTEIDVRRCLWLFLGSSSVVSALAILQSLQLLGIPALLATYYAPLGDQAAVHNNRGSSTLSLSAATADLMLLSLAVVVALAARRMGRPRLLAAAGAVVLLGVFASGQFSGIIGLAVALAALIAVTPRRRVFLGLLPVLVVAPVALWPVVAKRLAGFQGVSGWPESWVGRYNNLSGYFWPELTSWSNVLLGVRPSARVPGPRELGIDWVWIESGHTWLVWGGGLPLLLAYVVFTVTVLRTSWPAARARSDAYGVVATAVFVGCCVITVLMIFDPHLTYRGSADTFFALLAMLAGASAAATWRPSPSSSPRPAAPPVEQRR